MNKLVKEEEEEIKLASQKEEKFLRLKAIEIDNIKLKENEINYIRHISYRNKTKFIVYEKSEQKTVTILLIGHLT